MTTTEQDLTATRERYVALHAAATLDAENRVPGTWLRFFEMLRDEPALYEAHRTFDQIRKAARAGRNYRTGLRRFLRYSDARLDRIIAEGESTWAPGPYREAVILRGIAFEYRAVAVAEAHTFSNMTPDAGRWSDALRTCASRYPAEVVR